MPERVLTRFDSSDSENNVKSSPQAPKIKHKIHPAKEQQKKRKVEEAFGTTKSEPKKVSNNYLTEKHRRSEAAQAKVVNFRDGEDNHGQTSRDKQAKRNAAEAPETTTALAFLAKGRLRQRAADLLQVRQKLPIWPHAQEIRDKVKDNDVLLLVGETGSGKSTQIPQFLLEVCRRENVKGGSAVGGAIAITQPRRVAAISLAKRVAEEMGTPLGNSSPASKVGYSVRFDNSVSPSNRVKFLTDGMLLQELLRDPWLKEYSVVVVDEVHERGMNVDLVLGFLKRLIEGRNANDGRGGRPLKIVVMSATADMETIQGFFRGEVEVVKPGPEMDSAKSKKDDAEVAVDSSQKTGVKAASCYIKGRQYPVNVHYTLQPVASTLDSALERIIDIHTHSPLPGDVLVFLPGQETIDSLESMCHKYAQSLLAKSKEKGAPRLPKLLILPLFAALSTTLQQRVFDATPPFTRKIILSTNIAETSVTVPGIRHVIDTGKRKARFFRPNLNLDTLLTKAISRSSANQRTGRAGREAAGNCYRLYTEKVFYELAADTEPEILRCDLSQLVLTLKAHNVENILTFPLLTAPPRRALERALLHLLRLRALDRRRGDITNLGRQMSTLPLPANLARVLLASQLPQYDCVEEVIDVVSGLSVENIWLPIHNQFQVSNTQPLENPVLDSHKKESTNSQTTDTDLNGNTDDDEEGEDSNPIAVARQTLYRREGDHLTLLSAIQAYAAENVDRKDWCRRHAISHRAMSSAMDVRKQLRKLLLNEHPGKKSSRYKPVPETNHTGKKAEKGQPQDTKDSKDNKDRDKNTEDIHERVLKTLLLGLSENVARLAPQHNPSTSTSSAQSTSRSGTHTTTNNNNNNTTTTNTIWTGPYQMLSEPLTSTLSSIDPSTSTSTSTSTPTTTNTSNNTRRNFQIHPSSVLFTRGGPRASTASRPAYIMFSEFVVTGRAYVRSVSAIQGNWLDEIDALDELDGDAEGA